MANPKMRGNGLMDRLKSNMGQKQEQGAVNKDAAAYAGKRVNELAGQAGATQAQARPAPPQVNTNQQAASDAGETTRRLMGNGSAALGDVARRPAAAQTASQPSANQAAADDAGAATRRLMGSGSSALDTMGQGQASAEQAPKRRLRMRDRSRV